MMEITITAKDLELSVADDTYLRHRLCFGLAANHRDVDNVAISLFAAPGAESGGSYRCRVDIAMVDGSTAHGDSMETNLYVTMDRAVDRACSSITYNVDWNWRAFSQTDPASTAATRPSLAA